MHALNASPSPLTLVVGRQYGDFALTIAAIQGHTHAVKAILAADPRAASHADLVCHGASAVLVVRLLTVHPSQNGQTPLHHVVGQRDSNVAVVRAILSADPLTATIADKVHHVIVRSTVGGVC